MPVTTTHTDYEATVPLWKTCSDCDGGELPIRAGRTIYLPALNGQRAEDYDVYLNRASFPEFYGRTVNGAHGAILRKPTVIDFQDDPGLEALLDDSSLDGVSFAQQIKFALRQILVKGRLGILVDFDAAQQRPKIVLYVAESIRNWPARLETGVPMTRPIVLYEEVEERGPDEFLPDLRPQYRVLDIDEMGWYRQRIFRQLGQAKQWVAVDEILPDRRGQRLDFIPFLFAGVTDLTPTVESPPLLGLAHENLHYYRISADFESKHHWASVVQPYGMVANPDESYYFGSSRLWLFSPGDTVGMLETSGASLTITLEVMEKIKQNMAKLGATLFEEQKAGVEAPETVRLREGGRASVLGNIADTNSRAFTTALQWFAWWAGATEEVEDLAYSVHINNEFQETTMSAPDRQQTVAEWQIGLISKQTAQERLKRGGVIPEDRTVEEEEALIAAQPDFAAEELGDAAPPVAA